MTAIGRLRIERGLTHQQLADAVGKSKTTVRNWELGRVRPSDKDFPKIAEALGCSVEQIWIPPKARVIRVQRKPSRAQSAVETPAIAENREKAAPYKERRCALGMTQKELAKKASVSVSTVLHLETGKRVPCWDTRQKIRRALGMPEERSYTEEERNSLFFELEDSIHLLIRKNRDRIYAVHMDADDLYQDLAVCALRAIDRFQPDGKATLKTFVERNMAFLLERELVKFCMHGLSGKIHYPLPGIKVFSLDALMEEGLQMESDDSNFAYGEENRSWCNDHQERQVAVAV